MSRSARCSPSSAIRQQAAYAQALVAGHCWSHHATPGAVNTHEYHKLGKTEIPCIVNGGLTRCVNLGPMTTAARAPAALALLPSAWRRTSPRTATE